MAQIVDLNELVPQDIVLLYGDPVVEYRLPGDMDVETVFRLFELFRALSTTEGDDQEVVGQLRQRFGDIEVELLRLFQLRNPELEKLPFGMRATGRILQVVLEQLGVTVSEETPTPPSRPAKKAGAAARPRSRRR